MQRTVMVGLMLLLVLVTVLETGARPKIESEEELVRWVRLVKWINEGGEYMMCHFYHQGDLDATLEYLKEKSIQIFGREVRLEAIYHHITCDHPFAPNIDLIRMTAESPIKTRHSSKHLVFYFVKKAKRPDLLGKILMCRRDLAQGCFNVIEHMNMNEIQWKKNENIPPVERLHKFKKFLLKLLDEKYIVRDAAFCREYLDEPIECRNLPDSPIDWMMAE